MDPLDVIASTADAAFATDEEWRIAIWNKAAERLLGYEAAEVLGRPCHEILCGKDIFGNRYCDEFCAPTKMIRRREAVHHFELDIRKAGSVPSFVEKEKWRNLLLTKHIAQRGEGGLRRAEGYHD